jgi:hypothetical protein
VWWLLFVALVVIAIAVGAGVRRYGERDRPELGWRRTDEVFRDPGTGRLMRVWLDPSDGTRHYVPEGAAPPPPT